MTQAARRRSRWRSLPELLHLISTHPRADLSWGIAAWSLAGAWMVAALMFGLAFPHSILFGLLFGLVTGGPVFLPLYRHMRKNAEAEWFIEERAMEWAAGGSEALAQNRKRVAQDLGLDRVDEQTWSQIARWLSRVPKALLIFCAVAMLVMAADTESGFGTTFTAAMSGLFASWALILHFRGVAPIRSPDEPGG